MKPRLLILSDLWGRQKSEWLSDYIDLLSEEYEIKYYDCCELGKIDISDYQEKKLHAQFVNGGIEAAVAQLLFLEKNQVDVLAFSIGGAIAWKAALQGLNVRNLSALSATRLRHEIEKPNCTIKLIFGREDAYRPKEDWINEMSIDTRIIEEKGHDLYKSVEYFK